MSQNNILTARRLIVAVCMSYSAIPEVAAASTEGNNFDTIGMFVNAVPVVKAVMLLLVLASVVSWGLFLAKTREIGRGVRDAQQAAAKIRTADRLSDVSVVDAAASAMIAAAHLELEKSAALVRKGRIQGICTRVQDQLLRVENGMVARMREGLPILASVGSVAPFVGLFGTVWGIMHSFVGIAQAKSSSLSVVAPGIAEALLATALGLIAAIPATVMYNLLGKRMAAYRQSLGDGATLLICLVGRELEIMMVTEVSPIRSLARADG